MLKAPTSLKARALRHLARREHTRAELERKLAAAVRADARAVRGRGGADAHDGTDQEAGPGGAAPDDDVRVAEAAAEQVRRTLDELAASGLLDDARAAESLLAAQGRRFGSRRLKQALIAKGLAPELVQATVRQSQATEYERAHELWRRRFGQAPADAGERIRQMRFLLGRGFDPEIVGRILKSETRRGAQD